MPARKNEWLNAKPMTKIGGKSGGVRNPKKPYKKPTKPASEKPARWEAKTKSERLQEAAKTKAKSPAPKQVIKKPVTRTGPVKGPVPPKGYSAGAAGMPNSAKAQSNLPKAGARAERTATRANQLIKDARAKGASTPKPSPASGAASSATKSAGKVGKLAGAAGKALGAVGVVGAMASEVKAMSDRNKTFSWNRPKVKPDANGRSSRGVNTPKGRTVPTGSQQYNDYRNKQIADNRERLKSVGNPPAKRTTTASTQSGGGSTQSRSSGGGSSRPSSPAKPKKPFAGTVSEGRKMWAEKYSSSKYDGQAIQKEAKKLLEEMKKRKESKSNASKAGWDGNKNY